MNPPFRLPKPNPSQPTGGSPFITALLTTLSLLGLSSCQTHTPPPQPPHPQLVEITPKNLPGAIIDLKYATRENITDKALYDSQRAYIRPETLLRLQNAARKLRKHGYRLLIWDAWRTKHAQEELWRAYPNARFLAPPHQISRHRRGTSVDLSLCNSQGNPLEMPTEFDQFCPKANWDLSDVPPQAAQNAQILQKAMFSSGFSGVPDEWWHYDLQDWHRFPPIP